MYCHFTTEKEDRWILRHVAQVQILSVRVHYSALWHLDLPFLHLKHGGWDVSREQH